MKKYVFIINLFFTISTTHAVSYDLLVVKDPIVDFCSSYPIPHNLPIDEHSPRIHQGLFNELAHYIEEKDGYVKIKFDNIHNVAQDKSQIYFWSKKSNLIPMQDITNSKLRHTIPHPMYAHSPTIVLTYPWKNFSIGTRFKHVPELDSKTSFCIMRAHYKKNKPVYLRIPRENGMLEVKQTKKSARILFVTLVNNLVNRINHNNPGYAIPYVWGGNSFLKPYKTNDFYKKNGIWQRNGKREPYTGYDCSGFIMQMAQIAGIDFPWKTSSVMHLNLPHITKSDQLADGDLLWIEGHVIIISSVENNEIIEARGYDSDYGCLHRIKLHELLEDISTYSQLLDRYHKQKTITLKNKQGKPQKEYAFALLKLVD